MPLVGDIDSLSLADLLQLHGHAMRTCRVEVRSTVGPGELFLVDGQVVHACFAHLEGEDAVFALLSLPDASFEVVPKIRTRRRTVESGWQQLLLECARRQDEG